MKSLSLAAILLAATPLTAAAQYAYPYPYPPPAYAPVYPAVPAISPAQAAPPSWSYDPYTSGQAPCPQKRASDLQSCSQMMPPTYGQPSYWSK